MLGIVEVLKLVTGTGDAVVINSPVYAPFYQFIEHMDRRSLEIVHEDGHAGFLWFAALAFSGSRARAMMARRSSSCHGVPMPLARMAISRAP